MIYFNLFFKNKFEAFLNKIEVDLVYFAGPSQYSLYLEDTKFFITVPDVSHRENLELHEINSLEFQRRDNILKKAKPSFIETKNLVSNNQKNLINPSKWNNL